MNEEVKVMKDDRGVEYKCLTYTSRFTGETDVTFDIQQCMRRTKESYQRISKKMKRGEKIGN